MKLSTLYKRTSTGATQMWSISVEGNKITTEFGQVDGKISTTSDTIQEGKNLGKKNATTAEQQAEAEAQAKWTKQIQRKGYVEDISRAVAGETDAEGGIPPMLAHKYSEQGHKIQYPAYAQPKLDGSRCIAVIDHGDVTLWTRTRKPITGLPHIVAALKAHYLESADLILDGELYNHDYHNRFEELMSFIRSDEAKPGHEVVQYHIYDDASHPGPFFARTSDLFFYAPNKLPIVKVETVQVQDEEALMEAFEHFRALGYEGCMVRNAASGYVNKRSYDLQKVKEFDDGEFQVLGIEEGRGKLQGHVGAFVCVMPPTHPTNAQKIVTFKAKAKGELAQLKLYFETPSLWQGKKLTVQYQGMTGKNGVPRFPIGIRLRQEE